MGPMCAHLAKGTIRAPRRRGRVCVADLDCEFVLPQGPSLPIALVSGGVDLDWDGIIDSTPESLPFRKVGENVWQARKCVDGQVHGMKFVVQFTVGKAVPWRLTIREREEVVYFIEKTSAMWTNVFESSLP
jgi:hypothetical protein